ncbi:AMP-binding protein [Ramlibacter sp.]|uniref:AMP-binding protein n=1 Tax=Ramlibacter sp. TaxID=1917967 RepID=UPI003D0995FC
MDEDRARTLAQWLDARAEGGQGDDRCMVDGGVSLTWAELARRSRSLATGLAGLGVKRGDRVGLWLPNRSAWLATFLACARLGAIAVSINTRFRSAEVGDLLYRSGAGVLVYWPGYKAIDFEGILAQCGAEALQHLRTVVLYGEGDGVLPPAPAGKQAVAFAQLLGRAEMKDDEGGADAPCVIFTTSGTTKAPKLVLHKQENVLAHARNVARQYGLDAGKRFLLLPPFCGVYGFCSAMAALVSDSLLVLEAAWSPPQARELIAQHAITHFAASNEAVAQLLDAPGSEDAFASLELVVSANLNPAHADVPLRAAERGIVVSGLYGSSEMQALFSLCDPAGEPEVRGRAGGTPASAVARVRTRDPETKALCAPGVPGELEFLAPESGFVGYFNDPEATRAAFTDDGYFRSGDLGTMDGDGETFTYLARIGDTLRLGGFLVSPAEIEAVVQEHPAIESCQVVGARTKEAVRPVAFVIARPGQPVPEKDIVAHVAARLAKYKVPVRIIALDAFPTTASANGTKVQKTKLRDMAEAALERG